MKRHAQVVIGANYGDEGKGLMVDFLAEQDKSRRPLTVAPQLPSMVVRFNGGAQAGHTVETPEGQRHVFHHFGSGSFVGSSTYLSKHFIVNPVLFRQELLELETKLGYRPKVYVYPYCKVTTVYDMILNQVAERVRGASRHGSCGVGIGETIHRHVTNLYKNPALVLSAKDLSDPALIRFFLERMGRDWVYQRLEEIYPSYKVNPGSLNLADYLGSDVTEKFLADCKFFADNAIRTFTDDIPYEQNLIFEGAQGLLLDQNNEENFPHVTRSNTGLENVRDLLLDFGIESMTIFYMSRIYLTRHGVGPFPTEQPLDFQVEDRTNVPHDWQGNLRFGLLDVDALHHRITTDLIKHMPSSSSCETRVYYGLTCADQAPGGQVKWIKHGEVKSGGIADLVRSIEDSKEPRIKVGYVSFGPTRKYVRGDHNYLTWLAREQEKSVS